MENQIDTLTETAKEMRGAINGIGELKAAMDGMGGRLDEMEKRLNGGAEETEEMGEKLFELERKMQVRPAKPGGMASREMKAFANFMATGDGFERKAVDEQTGPTGRFALPLEFSKSVQDQLEEVNPLRKLAMVVSAQSTDFRHLVNLRGATSKWSGEVDTREETEGPKLAAIEPTFAEHYAYAKITQWAAQDLILGPQKAEAWLRENIVEEFARAEGEKFVDGTGVKEPFGLLTAPHTNEEDSARAFGTWQAINTGLADDFGGDVDPLISAVYSLGASYRRNGTFIMNSATAGFLRKMKDGDGRYVWTESIVQGQPARLLGYPVEIVEEMPDIATDATPIAFGDFKRAYMIADLQSMYVVRDEVTQPGWIKLFMFRRLASHVTDTKAMRLIKIAV